MVWSLLVSCAVAPQPSEEAESDPTAWAWENPDTGALPIVVSELQADLQANLDAARTLRATDPLNSFRAVMEYATPECPSTGVTTDTEDAGSTYYFDGLCFTEEMIFKGPALLHTWNDDRAEPVAAMEVLSGLPGDARWTGYGFNGQTDIYGLDGVLDFNCSCTMVDIQGVDAAGSTWFFGMAQGPAHYTGPEGTSTWMDDAGIDPAVAITVNDGEGIRSLQLSSTTSGIGERYDAVDFRLSGIAGRPNGEWNCAADAISATMDFRDSHDASWTSLSLTTHDSTCELCGTLESGEEICLDPRYALLDWEGSPWL